MIFNKVKAIAQIVGFVCIGMLAVYGALGVFNGGYPVQASEASAPIEAPQQAPQGAPMLASSSWGSATVPMVMNYQGNLKDTEGNSLSGYYTMTFRIYDDVIASLTDTLWSEIHVSVTVRAGHFGVLLGNNEPISETLFNDPDRFIGVQVSGYDEMVPRQRFASVPYAMYAMYATYAITVPDASITSDKIADGAVTQDEIADDAVTQAEIADGAVTTPKLDTNLGVSGNFTVAGNIGIGITSPTERLDVDGSIQYQAIRQVNLVTSTYSVNVKRYLVEATKDYVNQTIPLDMNIVNGLCQDADGCDVTVGMRDYHASLPGMVASFGPYRLFMSQTSTFWRIANTHTYGADGDGNTQHILTSSDCYFTDGEYTVGPSTDSVVQLGLLNYGGTAGGPDTVCVLIIED
ncbi:MAG: hypothetical protein GY832_31815 [Chloroflexi bacterium]|nr:hypothetical protein [Chloroflexota bacterium]